METPIIEKNQWSSLFKVASFSAILVVAFIPIQMTVFMVNPPPTSIVGWFDLFNRNAIIGLIDMDLLLIIDQVLMGLIFLALYQVLKNSNRSSMLIALTLAMLGIAAYFASTVALEMLSLSRKYSVATTEADKSVLLSAGQVLIATWQGTAFDLGYIMEGIAMLMISIVMLSSGIFSKSTSYIGIMLGIMSLIPPTVPVIGMFFAIGSLIPLILWLILIARKLFQLADVKK
jgi:hypothetical protein